MNTEAFEAFKAALGKIARGRSDCGRPLAAEISRQIAREVLDKFGAAWPKGARRDGGEALNDG